LPSALDAGVGSYVRFRFHGKLTRGWVLGPTDDVPARMLPVMRVVSPVRMFDAHMLELARWMSERYVAPLATVLGALAPPRVAGEELHADAPGGASLLPSALGTSGPGSLTLPGRTALAGVLDSYTGGNELRGMILGGPGAFVVRPGSADEQTVVVEAVAACLAAGRRALIVVPEADPLPATAIALIEAFGERVCVFAGGDARMRYRTWLTIATQAFDVVVGTRPAVFAPLDDVGLIWISRESHPGHREERAPYYHTRDVGLERARIEGAACVLAALCPSSEAAALGLPVVAPARRRWPKVEVVRPGPEGRAPRLIQALREARRGFVYSPLPGYGVAQVCRSCGEPAACASCGGLLRAQAGSVRCVVCQAPGRCSVCGAASFGIRRGGAERVEEWAGRVARVPVSRPSEPRFPSPDGEVMVGGPDLVRDLGVGDLDLVAILDADHAAARPGLAARERALAIWMEATAWARPNGRVVVQSSQASDPAVQALVRGNPDRFHVRERERRAAVGFPVGEPTFRVVGTTPLEGELETLGPTTLLSTALGERTVCLLAIEPGRVAAFGSAMRALAAAGVVERVEAEPHI
jgi:primosomal protein N' (replication factor Y)